jgi:hypothetical protein
MRLAALGGLFLIGGMFACAMEAPAEPDAKHGRASGLDGDGATDKATEVGTKTPAATAAPAVLAPLPTPRVLGVAETCKLINGTSVDDPSGNDLQLRTNLKGTDLGIPVSHDGTLYFFFGDSVGYRGIWNFGESQPDAVGFANAAAVTADPSVLCTQLDFLHLAADASIGPPQDPRIAHDWAAVSMTPPAGEALGDYIHNPAGHGNFPNLPGDFEVPSGAFSANGSVYVFYTTVNPQVQMKGSYLAKWQAPDPNGQPNLNILYHVDERFDANGDLRGDFINIATLVAGDYVYVYGSGEYRASPIQLARKKLADLDTAGGFERFDAATKSWKGPKEATAPIVSVAATGELSVRFYPAIGRYMMMAQEGTPTRNQIVARFAPAPEGPWSESVVVADMGDPGWRATYCCTADACNGQQLFHCDRAGFYGTYLLPDVKKNADGSFDASFLMSTWDPYNVALIRATYQ